MRDYDLVADEPHAARTGLEENERKLELFRVYADVVGWIGLVFFALLGVLAFIGAPEGVGRSVKVVFAFTSALLAFVSWVTWRGISGIVGNMIHRSRQLDSILAEVRSSRSGVASLREGIDENVRWTKSVTEALIGLEEIRGKKS